MREYRDFKGRIDAEDLCKALKLSALSYELKGAMYDFFVKGKEVRNLGFSTKYIAPHLNDTYRLIEKTQNNINMQRFLYGNDFNPNKSQIGKYDVYHNTF